MNTNAESKILVVDDEISLVQSLSAYLEDSGFKVCSAENGQKALEIFEREKPDLILTDLHMPVLGGLELLSNINKKFVEVPVIVLSGAGELNDAIAALRLGAWDYITKPISDLQVLEYAINKALERKKLLAENKMYAQRIEYNLKVLEEDQAAGRRVQMCLLPQDSLSVGNYQFKFKIIPSLELSGDFVEYFPINETTYGVYLADVSGHGASSAFITVLLKSLVAQYLAHYKINQDSTIMSPAILMAALSQEIYAAKLGKYLTIVYGVINIATNELVYGVGGHYPNPILLKSNSKSEYLSGSGFPVGVIANAKYEEQKITLDSGDKIIMYTDGIMELLLPRSNLDQKEHTLLDIVIKSNGDISAMLHACGDIADNKNPPDDITVLVISCA